MSIFRPAAGFGWLPSNDEANGVCATDARKYRVGVNDGTYPFNPGHEWVGRVETVGDGVVGWEPGQRLYGDTYGGYAELATIAVELNEQGHRTRGRSDRPARPWTADDVRDIWRRR